MKYSEIIEIEPFFDSTFNMTEEKENYWKQFITNEKFESNLKEIVNAFTSLTGDQHKSIWVQEMCIRDRILRCEARKP